MKILKSIEFVLNFLVFYGQVKICIGVTERGSLKNICKWCITCLFKGRAQRKTLVNMLRIYHAYAESTLSRLFVGTKAGFSHMTCNFSLMHVL